MKMFQNFLEKFGFPVVVALLLLYFVMTIIVSSLNTIKDNLAAHAAFATENFNAIKVNGAEIQKQTMLLEMICRNTAKNDFQSAQCDK